MKRRAVTAAVRRIIQLIGSRDADRWAGLLRYRPLYPGQGLAGAWLASHPDARRPGLTHGRRAAA